MEYILGIVVSLLVQLIKNKLGTDTLGTLGSVLVISIAAAGIYVAFSGSDFWPLIVQTLTVAGAFYAFIIQRFETK